MDKPQIPHVKTVLKITVEVVPNRDTSGSWETIRVCEYNHPTNAYNAMQNLVNIIRAIAKVF